MDFLSDTSVEVNADLTAFVSTILEDDPWPVSHADSFPGSYSRTEAALPTRPVDLTTASTQLLLPANPSDSLSADSAIHEVTVSDVTATKIPRSNSTATALVSSSTDLSDHPALSSSSDDVSVAENSAASRETGRPPCSRSRPRKIIAKASQQDDRRHSSKLALHFQRAPDAHGFAASRRVQSRDIPTASGTTCNNLNSFISGEQQIQTTANAPRGREDHPSCTRPNSSFQQTGDNMQRPNVRERLNSAELSHITNDLNHTSIYPEVSQAARHATTRRSATAPAQPPLSSTVPVTPIDMPPRHLLPSSFAKHPQVPSAIPESHFHSDESHWPVSHAGKDNFNSASNLAINSLNRSSNIQVMNCNQSSPFVETKQWALQGNHNATRQSFNPSSSTASATEHHNMHFEKQPCRNRPQCGGVMAGLSITGSAIQPSQTQSVSHSVYTNLSAVLSRSTERRIVPEDADVDSRAGGDAHTDNIDVVDAADTDNDTRYQPSVSHTKMCRDRLNNMFERLRETLPSPPPGIDVKHKAQVLDYTCTVLREMVQRTANLEAELALSSMRSTTDWAARAVQEAQTFSEAARKVMSLFCLRREWTVAELWLTGPSRPESSGRLRLDTTLFRDPEAAAADRGLAAFVATTCCDFGNLNSGIIAKTWSSMRPVWLAGLGNFQQFSRTTAAREAGLHTCLSVPIMVGGRVEAVILFFDKRHRLQDNVCLEIAMRLTWALGNAVGAKRASMLQRKAISPQSSRS